jgi:hypothetical protein
MGLNEEEIIERIKKSLSEEAPSRLRELGIL